MTKLFSASIMPVDFRPLSVSQLLKPIAEAYCRSQPPKPTAEAYCLLESQTHMSELQKVYSAKHPEQGALIVALLQQEGIDAKLDGAMLGSALGDIPAWWAAPKVLVPQEDFERARKIVTDWDAENLQRTKERVEQAMWTCPECSEEVEYNFEMCWNCQYNRTAC